MAARGAGAAGAHVDLTAEHGYAATDVWRIGVLMTPAAPYQSTVRDTFVESALNEAVGRFRSPLRAEPEFYAGRPARRSASSAF
jgi:hypothetical protein